MSHMDPYVNLHGFRADRVRAVRCSKCNFRLDTRTMQPLTKLPCPSCGNSLYVPARVGDYLLLRLLGRGGMGSVYGAWDTVLSRAVALKVMLPPDGQEMPDWASLEAEARSAARLNHPHIAQVYVFGYHRQQPYFVMELARGRQLDELIIEDDPLDARFAFGVALQIAEGLAQAADYNLLHSDIKPENIMIGSAGAAKLVDFGLAGTAGTGSAAAGRVVWGSPHYVAPERLRRRPASLRSDMYSLGATLYHVLTGKPPFVGDDPKAIMMARLTVPPPPLREARPDLPPEAEALLLRMMSVEPGQRHPTYVSLIGDIKRLLPLLGPELDMAAYAAERLHGRRNPTYSLRSSRINVSGRLVTTGGRSVNVEITAPRKTGFRIGWKGAIGLLIGLLFLVGAIYFAIWALKTYAPQMPDEEETEAEIGSSV